MKKNMAFKSFLVLVISLPLLFVAPAKTHAGEPTEQVKRTVDAVIQILNEKELKKPENQAVRSRKIRDVIEKSFDFAEMAKRSLGVYWRSRTPEEQKEFVSLFSDLLENTYIKKIERYENEKVSYVGEKTEGQYAVVNTSIKTSKEADIPVDYKIFRKESKWEVYDIIVEGVSLVNNYRTQFSQIIGSSSYAELVKKLKAKKNP